MFPNLRRSCGSITTNLERARSAAVHVSTRADEVFVFRVVWYQTWDSSVPRRLVRQPGSVSKRAGNVISNISRSSLCASSAWWMPAAARRKTPASSRTRPTPSSSNSHSHEGRRRAGIPARGVHFARLGRCAARARITCAPRRPPVAVATPRSARGPRASSYHERRPPSRPAYAQVALRMVSARRREQARMTIELLDQPIDRLLATTMPPGRPAGPGDGGGGGADDDEDDGDGDGDEGSPT